MRVEQTDMLTLLGAANASFTVPVYQRPYIWGSEQLNVLLADALRAAQSGSPHFTGTVFFAPSPLDDAMRELALIDGQQRMVSLYLIVNALAVSLASKPELSATLDAEMLRCRYLCQGEVCKLLASRLDQKSMEHVVLGAPLPPEDEQAEAILKNHEWLLSQMERTDFSADELWRGLGLLQVIAVEAQEGDRAQSIFETLNAKGMPLSECHERFARIHHERNRTVEQIGGGNKVFGD